MLKGTTCLIFQKLNLPCTRRITSKRVMRGLWLFPRIIAWTTFSQRWRDVGDSAFDLTILEIEPGPPASLAALN